MARYERDYLGNSENDLYVEWTTRDGDHPFMICVPANERDAEKVIKLNNVEARDLALFLTRYLLEYVE